MEFPKICPCNNFKWHPQMKGSFMAEFFKFVETNHVNKQIIIHCRKQIQK